MLDLICCNCLFKSDNAEGGIEYNTLMINRHQFVPQQFINMKVKLLYTNNVS